MSNRGVSNWTSNNIQGPTQWNENTHSARFWLNHTKALLVLPNCFDWLNIFISLASLAFCFHQSQRQKLWHEFHRVYVCFVHYLCIRLPVVGQISITISYQFIVHWAWILDEERKRATGNKYCRMYILWKKNSLAFARFYVVVVVAAVDGGVLCIHISTFYVDGVLSSNI